MNGNGLAIRSNGPVVAPTNPLAALPQWLQYFIGAYPTSKTTPGQLAVMEDQFVECEPDLLLSAAREFVRSDGRDYRGFPTAPEFRAAVERVQARDEEMRAERAAAAHLDWFDACQELRARRQDVMELWYAGDVTAYQVELLANEFEAAGLVSAAASLRGRVA